MTTLLKFALKFWPQIVAVLVVLFIIWMSYCEGYDAAAAKYTQKAFLAQQEAITRTKELRENLDDFKRRRYELEQNDQSCKDIFTLDIGHCLDRLHR